MGYYRPRQNSGTGQSFMESGRATTGRRLRPPRAVWRGGVRKGYPRGTQNAPRTANFIHGRFANRRLAPGLAAEVLVTLRESPRFARIRTYIEESLARPSAQKTWDPVSSLVFLREWGSRGCPGWDADSAY